MKRRWDNGKIMEILLDGKEMSSAFLRQLMNIFPSDMKMQINSEDHLLYKNLFELFKKYSNLRNHRSLFLRKLSHQIIFKNFKH